MSAKKFKVEDFYGLANARRPWADTPSGREPTDDVHNVHFHCCDSPKAVKRCLNCTRNPKFCFGNCTGNGAKAKKRPTDPKIEERRKRVLELRAKELTYQQIAEILGCTKTVVNSDLKALRSKGVYV